MSATGLAFTFAFLVLIGFAIFRHPRYGMFAYLAAFYFHPPSRWWGEALPDLRWSLLASAVTLIALLRFPKNPNQPPWYSTTPAKIMIALTAWMWLQTLWSEYPDENIKLSILYSKFILLYFFVYRLCDNETEIGWFFFAHVMGCFYLGTVAYGMPAEGGRLNGVGGPAINDANALAMQLATGAVAGAMIVLVERKWKLLACVVGLAFILNTIVLCGSRGAFLSIVCAGFVLMVMKPKEYRRAFYGLAALGVAMFLVVASAQFWDRMSTIGAAVEDGQELDNSSQSRFAVVKAQLRMAAEHPLGLGHRGTVAYSREYIEERYLERLRDGSYGARSSHNTLMTAWVEHGIPGLIFFIWMALWCKRAARRVRLAVGPTSPRLSAYAATTAASLTIVLIAGMFVDYFAMEVQVWMFAILASMEALSKKDPNTLLAPSSDDPAYEESAPLEHHVTQQRG